MSDVLNVLAAAILKRFNTDAEGATLRGLVTGGMWYERAPYNQTPPYIDFTLEIIDKIKTYDSRIEVVVLTFSIFSGDKQTPKETFNIFSALTSVYDYVVLTVTGFKMVKCERDTDIPLKDPDNEGYQNTVGYTVWIG
jgi:hypothetical protein